MHRSALMRLVPSVGLLVILVVLALSACGGGGGGGGGEEKAEARPLPEQHRELRPGEYRTEEFKPSASFRVGEGWLTSPPEASDVLELEYGATAGLAFTNVQEVYKPTEAGTTKVMEPPEDLAGWFQHHPYLKTGKPEPITVGGVKGVEFDVVVAEGLPEDHVSQCGTDCVDVFEQRFGHQVILFEGDKVHFIVLDDVEGETLTIDYGGLATDFDEVAPEAQKVVESVKWGAS
jgi:hypothetical protein